MCYWLTILGLISIVIKPNHVKENLSLEKEKSLGSEDKIPLLIEPSSPSSSKQSDKTLLEIYYLCQGRILSALFNELYGIYCSMSTSQSYGSHENKLLVCKMSV